MHAISNHQINQCDAGGILNLNWNGNLVMHVTAGACMQRWLEDTDLDKIMQNYDANNDGKHLLRSTAAVEERTNTRESILGFEYCRLDCSPECH